MKNREFERIHEKEAHGTLRFHLNVHEFTSDPSRAERVSPHWHEEYELLCICEGEGSAQIGGRRFSFAAGDILFIDAGCVHSLSAPVGTPLSFYAVDFGRDLIDSYGNDDIRQKYIHPQSSRELRFCNHFSSGDEVWPQLSAALSELLLLYRQGISGNELLLKACLLQLWHFLSAHPATNVSVSTRDDRNAALAKEILQFIQENYASNLTLSHLASRFYMSEGQFCRFFKSQIGMTAIEYLNYYRIGVACDLLRREGALSDTSVSSVAMACGYGNISYFNRVFRRYMHCTPREYKQKNIDS
ncbi:MAG: AraC family transcriptional regulator [Eubacteriales bacterium]|nr:AraC family transcriptional regulator [Eubacteriales bacterium]